MIIAVTRNGTVARPIRRRAAAEPAAAMAGGQNPSGRQRGDVPTRQPGTALVPVAPAAASARSFVTLRPLAAFLTQLAALALPASGERRSRDRRSETVAPRAAGAYRAADRLATDLEPGFLIRREF